jgi:hypothetical protein
MAIHLVIAIAKPVPVLLDKRRRYGRIAKARMALSMGRCSPGNIPLSRLEAIMEALLSGL